MHMFKKQMFLSRWASLLVYSPFQCISWLHSGWMHFYIVFCAVCSVCIVYIWCALCCMKSISMQCSLCILGEWTGTRRSLFGRFVLPPPTNNFNTRHPTPQLDKCQSSICVFVYFVFLLPVQLKFSSSPLSKKDKVCILSFQFKRGTNHIEILGGIRTPVIIIICISRQPANPLS